MLESGMAEATAHRGRRDPEPPTPVPTQQVVRPRVDNKRTKEDPGHNPDPYPKDHMLLWKALQLAWHSMDEVHNRGFLQMTWIRLHGGNWTALLSFLLSAMCLVDAGVQLTEYGGPGGQHRSMLSAMNATIVLCGASYQRFWARDRHRVTRLLEELLVLTKGLEGVAGDEVLQGVRRSARLLSLCRWAMVIDLPVALVFMVTMPLTTGRLTFSLRLPGLELPDAELPGSWPWVGPDSEWWMWLSFVLQYYVQSVAISCSFFCFAGLQVVHVTFSLVAAQLFRTLAQLVQTARSHGQLRAAMRDHCYLLGVVGRFSDVFKQPLFYIHAGALGFAVLATVCLVTGFRDLYVLGLWPIAFAYTTVLGLEGELIQESSETVLTSAFAGNWQDCGLAFAKDIVMLSLRAGKPAMIRAAWLGSLSLPTLQRMLNSWYSFTQLLIRLHWNVSTPGVKAEGTLLPSPASPSAVIVSPETLSLSRHSSRQSSPGSTRAAGTTGTAPSSSMVADLGAEARAAAHPHPQAYLAHAGMPPSRSMVSSVRYAASGTGPGPGYMMAPVPYHHHHHGHMPIQLPISALKRPSRIEQLQLDWKQMGTDALATTLSALYGKLLVVMGIAFPMAEVISTYIPPSFYEGFYLYLYFGSMLFLLYMYAMLLKDKAAASVSNSFKRAKRTKSISSPSHSDSDSAPPSPSPHTDTELSTATEQERYRSAAYRRQSGQFYHHHHYGSFYLRMGAVAFGIGSMIYSGLEFGQYFELERNTKCHNVLLALTPATRMAFIFIQMYFIFLNNEEMKVYKHRTLARFGLMHMIGTNLSVWLNVLIQETKHEILTFYNPENNTLGLPSHRAVQHGVNWFNFPSFNVSPSPTLPTLPVSHHAHHHAVALTQHALDIAGMAGTVQHRVARGLKGPHHIYECRRTNIIGSLVQDASPFLFPCTIEYSLICAAILYVMWKNIARMTPTTSSSHSLSSKVERAGTGMPGPYYKRSPHHYSVDCARAHKGLFVGILILVLTILSLILFFVLTSREEFVYLAVIEVNICELSLYAMSTIATLFGMLKVRQLRYDGSRNLELDSILLIGAQTGMFLYSTFTVIGGHFTMEKNTALVLITALASLVQTTCQTMFVLDASRRSCVTPEQIRRKPGREIVTFLLVTNLAMWAINTLEKSRAESHPIQLHFYGLWAWTIITHVSMPLAIFYRFHSTVCLCEIWKKAYKMKPVYM